MISRRAVSLSLAGLVVGCIWNIGPVQARRLRLGGVGRGIAAGTRVKNYSPDTLTQTQLEDCLASEDRIDQLEAALQTSEQEISRLRADLDLQEAALDAGKRTVNRYSQFEVDRYNARAAEFARARVQFNRAVEAHNQRILVEKNSVGQYNIKCASKKYFEDDLEAAKSALASRSGSPTAPAQTPASSSAAPNMSEHLRRMIEYK